MLEQASPPDTAAMASAISLAEVAGTWDMKTMAMGSDSVIVTSQMMATGTMEGWTLKLAGRDPIPVARYQTTGADSVVTLRTEGTRAR